MKLQVNYQIGDKVRMSQDALDNYGEEYADTILIVTDVSVNTDQHPGFDEGCGSAIYDFEGFNNSLYEWEMIYVS